MRLFPYCLGLQVSLPPQPCQPVKNRAGIYPPPQLVPYIVHRPVPMAFIFVRPSLNSIAEGVTFGTSDIPTRSCASLSFRFSNVDVIQAGFQVVLEGVNATPISHGEHRSARVQAHALFKPKMHLEVGRVHSTELGPSFRP